jgi:hypothetical protein
MARNANSIKISLFGFLRSKAHSPQSTPVNILRAFQRIEEKRAPYYNRKHFYTMQLHAILPNRYQVAAKLGWGTSSTVWLVNLPQ